MGWGVCCVVVVFDFGYGGVEWLLVLILNMFEF